MTSFKPTKLDPELNIHGSNIQTDMLVPGDEFNKLGSTILGQSGSNASIVSASGDLITIIGLTGMSDSSTTRVITISGAANPNNNGTFPIVSVVSAASVIYSNAIGTAPDPNNGFISWQERNNYSLQDDLNYTRTDRSNIKGVSYYSNVPVYQRPDNIGTNVPVNLSNITARTADALAYVMDRVFFGAVVGDGYTQVTLVSPGNLKHADPVNTLGVPAFDAAPFAGDYASCTVSIKNATVADGELAVLGGPHIGERIFGLSYVGASVSPNSIEVRFYSVSPSKEIDGYNISPYVWETGQPHTVNMIFGFNERLDQLDKNAFRTIPVIGAFVEEIDYDFLLDNIPNSSNFTYTNTLTSGKVTQEKWLNTNNSILVKTIDYTYSGSAVVSEIRKIYDITGLVVVAQMTLNYVVSNNTIISYTVTRNI